MQALSVRFPDALIEEWAPVFFMALVVRLVNDPSAACRDMNEQALKTLLQVRPRHNSPALDVPELMSQEMSSQPHAEKHLLLATVMVRHVMP